MTVKPRTIDNMGIDTSSRYARDQATLNTKLITDSHSVAQQAEVSVLTPYLPSEFAEYLVPSQRTLWASFAPPPDFLTYARPLFSYQLIPSLGSYEKQEADENKLAALEDTLNKSFQDNDQQHDEGESPKERERKILVNLLQTIKNLDRALTLINACRNQYQRG